MDGRTDGLTDTQTDRNTHTHKLTNTQADRHTKTDTHKQTVRQTNRHTHTHKQSGRHTQRQIDIKIDQHILRHTFRQADIRDETMLSPTQLIFERSKYFLWLYYSNFITQLLPVIYWAQKNFLSHLNQIKNASLPAFSPIKNLLLLIQLI